MWNQKRNSEVSSSLLLLLLRRTHISVKPGITDPNTSVNFPICFFQDAFQKIAETYGGVDIFCNNAGIMNEIQWQKAVSINLVRQHGDPRFFCLTWSVWWWWWWCGVCCRCLPSRGITWLWSTWAGRAVAAEGSSSTSPPWPASSTSSYHLPERFFSKEGLKSPDIILGCLTLCFCRYRSSAIMSCLYGHQARTGWLHSSHGGEGAARHGSWWCYILFLIYVCVQTGCLCSIGLRRAYQRALSQFRPNWALFQRLVQTGTVLPSGWRDLSVCREAWDIKVGQILACITPFIIIYKHICWSKASRFSVGEVAECFLELATDETKNGEALLLLPKKKQYVTFPSFV